MNSSSNSESEYVEEVCDAPVTRDELEFALEKLKPWVSFEQSAWNTVLAYIDDQDRAIMKLMGDIANGSGGVAVYER